MKKMKKKTEHSACQPWATFSRQTTKHKILYTFIMQTLAKKKMRQKTKRTGQERGRENERKRKRERREKRKNLRQSCRYQFVVIVSILFYFLFCSDNNNSNNNANININNNNNNTYTYVCNNFSVSSAASKKGSRHAKREQQNRSLRMRTWRRSEGQHVCL